MRDSRYASLLSVIGFALFWTVSIVAMTGGLLDAQVFQAFSGSFAPVSLLSFVDRFLLLLGFAGVCLASHFGCFDRIVVPEAHQPLRIAIAVCAVLFSAIAVAGVLGFAVPAVLRAGVWLAFGACLGLLAVLWGLAFSLLDAERPDGLMSAMALAGTCVLAVVMALFMLFAPAVVSAVVSGVMIEASLVLHILVVRQFPPPERIDRRTSQQRLKLFSRNMLSPGVVGCSLGCVLVLAFLRLGAGMVFPLCLMGIALGGLIGIAALAVLKRVPRFSSIERLAFTVLGAGLLTLPFAESLFAVVIVTIIGAITCYLVFHWSVLVALSYRHHVQPVFHYSQGLIAPVGGMALGWAATVALAWGLGWDASAVLTVAVPAMVFLLILDLAVVPYASNKTVETVFLEETDLEAEEPPATAKTWRTRCEAVCAAYALTPREQEVFLLLAKGRNAEHIGKQLFISTHTVKTHTSRIYRKLSINSQQELIDLVDTREAKEGFE